MRLNVHIPAPGARDWETTLRHEYGHVHRMTANDSIAGTFGPMCLSSTSPTPGNAATPILKITTFFDSIPVGVPATFGSNCNWGTPTWSATGAASVSSNGVVTGSQVGSSSVTVTCQGQSASRTVTVYSPDMCILSRLRGPVTGAFYGTYEDCDGGEAPSPPTGGMGEDGIEVCYNVIREYWEFDVATWSFQLMGTSVIGQICFLYGNMT